MRASANARAFTAALARDIVQKINARADAPTVCDVGRVGSLMDTIHNGVTADELPGADWRKSSFSGAVGNCVELSWFEGQAGVRNSRDPHGPVLVVPTRVLQTFVTGAKERSA